MIERIIVRWHRWRVFRTAPGSPERKAAVRAYMSWAMRKRGAWL